MTVLVQGGICIPDLTKIIKGLECCVLFNSHECTNRNCPYWKDCGAKGASNELLHDALALLKAQEPRLLAWREVIGAALECKPVFIEVKDSEDKGPGDDRWAMVTQYKDSITNGMIRAMSSYVTSEILFEEYYCKSWRCWDKEPTDEHRKKEPWNG